MSLGCVVAAAPCTYALLPFLSVVSLLLPRCVWRCWSVAAWTAAWHCSWSRQQDTPPQPSTCKCVASVLQGNLAPPGVKRDRWLQAGLHLVFPVRALSPPSLCPCVICLCVLSLPSLCPCACCVCVSLTSVFASHPPPSFFPHNTTQQYVGVAAVWCVLWRVGIQFFFAKDTMSAQAFCCCTFSSSGNNRWRRLHFAFARPQRYITQPAVLLLCCLSDLVPGGLSQLLGRLPLGGRPGLRTEGQLGARGMQESCSRHQMPAPPEP